MADQDSIGPYRILRRLGAGGMGEVFLAQDERLERLVAIKRLRADREIPPERRARFRREARIAARLSHPAIVRIYDVLREGDDDIIVMEYVEGHDLRQRIETGPVPVAEVLALAHQLALGMAEAHRQGIIHRDLKSENVLITAAGQVKITDFGIAKLHGEDALTADGAVVGTFRSMSPEQALGKPVDHRSDLFSFGSLLYEALAGESPFQGETPFLILQRVVHDHPRPITSLVPGIPHALAALISQLLNKDPRLRPRDFHEVAEALLDLAGEVCDGPCTGPVLRSSRPLSTTDETQATPDPDAPAEGEIAAALPDAPTAQVSTELLPVGPDHPGASASAPAPPSTQPARFSGRTRRMTALAMAGAVAVLGLGYMFWAQRARTLHIVVPSPRIEAPAELPDRDLMAVAVRTALVRGMLAREGLVVLPLDDTDIVIDGFKQTPPGRQPLQHELMQAMGADELISSRLTCTLQSCRVTLQRLARDGSTGQVEEPEEFDISPTDIRHSDQPISAHLSRLYPDHPVRDTAETMPVAPEDYEQLLRLRNAYWGSEQAPNTDQLLDDLQALRERAPGFIEVHRFEAEVLLHRYAQTADPDILARARHVLAEAEKRAPDSDTLLPRQFDLALMTNDLESAQELLGRLETLDPGSGTTLVMRGQLLARRGQRDQALEVLQSAAARDSSWRILFHLADVERQLGKRDQALAHIAQLLQRSPGNYAGQSLLARVELERGRIACAAERYYELVKRKPYYDECNNLGVVETLLDRYQEAAESYRCALKVRPKDLIASFNLAESLKLAGDTTAANEQFRRILEALQQDSAPRTDSARRIEVQTLAHLAHLAQADPALATQARARTEQMLAQAKAPEQFQYAAAVAYALLGDQARAVEHVRALLDRESPPDWFRFPWFADVRRDPALQQRLAYTPPVHTCE